MKQFMIAMVLLASSTSFAANRADKTYLNVSYNLISAGATVGHFLHENLALEYQAGIGLLELGAYQNVRLKGFTPGTNFYGSIGLGLHDAISGSEPDPVLDLAIGHQWFYGDHLNISIDWVGTMVEFANDRRRREHADRYRLHPYLLRFGIGVAI